MKFTPSTIILNAEILRLLESISKKQGLLDSSSHDLKALVEIGSVANIDAVHYSTKIEGNQLTRDQVTLALTTSKKIKAQHRDLHEILNYSRARRLIQNCALKRKPLDHDWILLHHSEILKGIVRGKLKGHYREAQCVIQDSKTKSIIYMAPEWSDVKPLMTGLLSWLRSELKKGGSPSLVAAQFHFELVTIHPFMDGNGRLARLLTNNILFSQGYDVEKYASLEKQHEKNRARYYQSLRTHQAQNFYDIPIGQNINAWIIYWLTCLDQTYDEALQRVKGKPFQKMDDSHSSGVRLEKAKSIFFRHQTIRASEYADLMNLGRTQAVEDLNELLKKGLIEKVAGGRSTIYRLKKP